MFRISQKQMHIMSQMCPLLTMRTIWKTVWTEREKIKINNTHSWVTSPKIQSLINSMSSMKNLRTSLFLTLHRTGESEELSQSEDCWAKSSCPLTRPDRKPQTGRWKQRRNKRLWEKQEKKKATNWGKCKTVSTERQLVGGKGQCVCWCDSLVGDHRCQCRG